MVIVDAGQNKTEVVHEISPFVIKVTDELNQIVKSKHSREDQMAIIVDELNRLSEETNTRIAYINTLVSKCG
jgi:ABC-type transporter Mla subunit MlaD